MTTYPTIYGTLPKGWEYAGDVFDPARGEFVPTYRKPDGTVVVVPVEEGVTV